MLLGRPGELVTREEIQQELWPSGTFVDFENGLNSAVNRLRDALGDSAEEPKFIETIPRRGYRFLAPVERVNGNVTPIVEAKPEPRLRRSERWFWATAFSVIAVVALTSSLAWRFYYSPKKTLNFGARDWVLISSFENRTGNPVLDGTVEYALEREVGNSQFVNVVSRERVGDALKLMRKPLETKIDAALGREICLRDGGIRALLTGRVEKLGTTYVLSTEVVNPANGVAVASLSEEDPADSQMATSVRRLSNRVRETLGEKASQIQQSNERLEKVTTPSLHALQLYTQAEQLMHSGEGQTAAAGLLKQALAEDPNFASAHLLLAYTYGNREGSCDSPKCSSQMHENARLEFERAFDLANATSDRERFFILASYYEAVKKDKPKAIEAYEALLRLYPDHFWAANNLVQTYLDVGQWDDAWRLSVHPADLRPDDLNWNEVAACGKYLAKDPNGAKPYMERARAVAAADPKGPALDDFVELLPIFYSWSKGDVSQAHEKLTQLARAEKGINPGSIAQFFWALGELAEADQLHQDNPFGLGMGAYIKGDLQAAKKTFRDADYPTYCGGCTMATVMARSGLWNRVEGSARKGPADSPGVEILKGEHALSLGRTKEGINLLEKAIDATHNFPNGAFFLGSETLARTYEKQGNPISALRVLQQASDAKGKAYTCFYGGGMTGAYWLRDELQLADLYRKMGRVPEAVKVEDELRKMLIYADTDHPILRELQKRNFVNTAVSSK